MHDGECTDFADRPTVNQGAIVCCQVILEAMACGVVNSTGMNSFSFSTAAHGAVHLAFLITLLEVFAPIAMGFPPGERQRDFAQPAVIEINAQRHQRLTALQNLGQEFGDLPLVQQEFARPGRLVFITLPCL